MITSVKPSICFGIFHIDGSECVERHRLKDDLIFNIRDLWENLNIETVSFKSLFEAEKMAKALNLNLNHIKEDRKSGTTGFMKGEIGIWIGTILALNRFLDSEFDILVLFEDDVISTKDGVDIANQYLINPPKGFDVFALYTPENQNDMYGRKRHVKSYLIKHLWDNPSIPTKLYQHWSLASYAISRKGARKILKSIEKEICMPIDWHIFRGHYNSFSFKPTGPKPFALANLESTIQTDRKDA